MKNLIAFGCSSTYGQGLTDCHRKIDTPSNYAWSVHLGEVLEHNVISCSRPGSSNFEILHRILNRTYTDNDMCVIMWTFPERDMIFRERYSPVKTFSDIKSNTMHTEESGSIIRVVGNMKDENIQKDWIMVHNSVDCIVRSWYYIHHASLHLNSLGIKNYHYFLDGSYYKDLKPSFVTVDPKDTNLSARRLDNGLDMHHVGLLTHMMLANEIYEDIKKDLL